MNMSPCLAPRRFDQLGIEISGKTMGARCLMGMTDEGLWKSQREDSTFIVLSF
jgi:hypothetical protein